MNADQVMNKVVSPHAVWRRMRQLTGRKIEKRAVFELVCHVERQIDRIILRSMEEFEALNEARKVQGLRQKVMIDGTCVAHAIKNMYSDSIYIVPEKGGGERKESGDNEERHPQLKRSEVFGYG